MNERDAAKLAAGRAAVREYVRDGMKLGLGSGTTSHWFVRALGEAVAGGLDVVGAPTSRGTGALAEEVGVRLAPLDELAPLDITVDGADEIDREGAMIKGGGACLLWEKIVANASRRMVAVVDAETAQAAGVRCALVEWGLGEDAGARRIARFADLLDLDEEAA